MKLYVARHGRTNYNDLGLCNGDPSVDVHLTEIGVQQAEALAEQLKQAQFDHIFVSEMSRTQQTAEIINRFHHTEVTVDARLNDGKSGFEGRPATEYWGAMDAADNMFTTRFNDGESIEDVRRRVANFLDGLRTQDYAAVLIVTSKWIVEDMLMIIQNLSYEASRSTNTEPGTCHELEI